LGLIGVAVGFAVLVTVIGAGFGVATAVGFTGCFLPLSLPSYHFLE
jgi:hypothetical protein